MLKDYSACSEFSPALSVYLSVLRYLRLGRVSGVTGTVDSSACSEFSPAHSVYLSVLRYLRLGESQWGDRDSQQIWLQ